jgi:hypothetical protein
MNQLALLEWAVTHREEAAELVIDFQNITPPSPGHFSDFVNSSQEFQKTLAHLADSLPVDPLKGLKSHQTRKRCEDVRAELKAIGDGHLIQSLEQIAGLAAQLWGLWNQFKPA